MQPIIIPAGTVARWSIAHESEDPAVWDKLACDLLRDGKDETDATLKDDICLLCLVACWRADDCDMAVADDSEVAAPEPAVEVYA